MEQKINTTVDDDDDNYDGNRSKKKDIKSMQKHAEACRSSSSKQMGESDQRSTDNPRNGMNQPPHTPPYIPEHCFPGWMSSSLPGSHVGLEIYVGQ